MESEAFKSAEAEAIRRHEPLIVPTDPASVVVAQNHSRAARVAEWARLRSEGLNTVKIAKQLGIAEDTLRTYISKAAAQGWLKLEDPLERLELEIAPKVVDNIDRFLSGDLDNKNLKMTIETAKGIGLFRAHQVVKVEGQPAQSVLALKIEINGDDTSKPRGTIVGRPKVVDAEVIGVP